MTDAAKSQFDQFLSSLNHFRNVYLEVNESQVARNKTPLNIPEFALLHVRGGRRVPLWIRSIRSKTPKADSQFFETKSGDIQKLFIQVLEAIRYFRVIPSTRSATLASYVSGNLIASAKSLADFAGIGVSTAHVWLRKCHEIGLLHVFSTSHEIYYINVTLIELVLTGREAKGGLFQLKILADLEKLRARKDWLAESAVLSFYNHYS